jgi:hypothetical protein
VAYPAPTSLRGGLKQLPHSANFNLAAGTGIITVSAVVSV